MLTGLSPKDIESLPEDQKLEAYRVVYKAFWDAKEDSQKVSERFRIQYEEHVASLEKTIEDLKNEI